MLLFAYLPEELLIEVARYCSPISFNSLVNLVKNNKKLKIIMAGDYLRRNFKNIYQLFLKSTWDLIHPEDPVDINQLALSLYQVILNREIYIKKGFYHNFILILKKNSSARSFLHYAIDLNLPELIKLSMMNVKDSKIMAPIKKAIKYFQSQNLELLIQKPDFEVSAKNNELLIEAVLMNNLHAVCLILAHKNFRSLPEDGVSILQAFLKEDDSIFRYLIKDSWMVNTLNPNLLANYRLYPLARLATKLKIDVERYDRKNLNHEIYHRLIIKIQELNNES